MSTQVTTASAEVEAFVELLRAHAHATRRLNSDLLGEHGLTMNDYEVLLRLSRAPERRMRRVDLAESVLLTPSGITRLLDGLERAGLVRRAECASDRRVVYAELTADGVRKLRAASRTHLREIEELFGSLYAPGELETLRELLARVPLA